MVGSVISTYMMFLPEATKWFCLIGLFVFFFGIYIPYDKYKQKKKKQAGKEPPQKQTTRKTAARGTADDRKKQLEQLETLRKAGLLSEDEFQEKKRNLR